MKKGRGVVYIYSAAIVMLVSSIALGLSVALYTNSDTSDRYGTSGEISLRSYYDSGTGTKGDPYVITRPRHLYNLSRLQGLGVYGLGPNGERTYFQLGKKVGNDIICYVDETNETKPYLDMKNSNYYNNPINAIGSEAQPFYGIFEGQNVEIKNLTVYADPEDAGLFGYTAHGSIVRDLFLDNVTINAMGYTDFFSNMYSPTSTITNNAYFQYDSKGVSPGNITQFTSNSIANKDTYFYKKDNDFAFEFNSDDNRNSLIPEVTVVKSDSTYDYYPLISGDLITYNKTTGIIKPDLDAVFDFFNSKINEPEPESNSFLLHLLHNQSEKDLKLTVLDANTNIEQYYRRRVPLKTGDEFKINLNGAWRGFSDIKTDSPVYSSFEVGSENDNIKVKADGYYDIYTKTAKGNGEKTIYIRAHDTALDPTYPLNTSSSASLIAVGIDNDGLKHSKVLMNLRFDFTLNEEDDEFIKMNVYVGNAHSNNIGVIAGHCDGTITDCYVYEATLNMNNGDTITSSPENTYKKMSNGSNIGLVGLIGSSVHNAVSSGGVGTGSDIGVLDFTTIYSQIINSASFTNSQNYGGEVSNSDGVTYQPITYTPVSTSKYLKYLRHNQENGKYVTLVADSVSFKGQEVISNKDLGVFTVATDKATTGLDGEAANYCNRSVIKKENLAIGNNNYYVYYAMGEYNKPFNDDRKTKITYETYRASFNNDSPEQILPGHHLPNRNNFTQNSVDIREQRQNYVFRFKLDPTYRKNNGFYFSDVDTDSDGGALLANYFNNKLVDQNNVNIAIGRAECGVMLKDSLNIDISNFSASFALPDLSHKTSYWFSKDEKKYIENTINFEITTPYANVTVVAAPMDRDKPAALGVYNIDNQEYFTENYMYTKPYNEPDYAFFMPDDNHLAYFDYTVQDGVGKIGTYDSSGNFSEANYLTNATVPNNFETKSSEWGSGYASHYETILDENEQEQQVLVESKTTRLFAHTFYLKEGRYCLGSATGVYEKNSKTNNQTNVKVFYICAQGQEEGQLGFEDTVFSGVDTVEKIDFVKQPRFTINNNGTYSENYSYTSVNSYRCHVTLANKDRSLFAGDKFANIHFIYNSNFVNGQNKPNGALVITTDVIAGIIHVSVYNDSNGDTYVSLFGADGSNSEAITYSP